MVRRKKMTADRAPAHKGSKMCVGEEEQSRVADKNNAGNRNPAEREGWQRQRSGKR